RTIKKLLEKHDIKAMANITGGGMAENIPRVIPKQLAVEIREGTWKVPPIFDFLKKTGDVPRDEMYRVFNMGVGMILVVSPGEAGGVLKTLRKAGERPSVVGKVVRGKGKVHFLEA
ncbi:MAG TPA: AIR synthase-related protein, partial [Planctomycetota bacterium]|nr:AIR synthase-related protein [Planctomycetota bacterium]